MSDLTVGGAPARVFDEVGRPVGAAFLVAPGHLLTAAHVVNLACGLDPDGVAQPAGGLFVDFPTLPGGRRYSAQVVHWVPRAASGPEDIAGLRLDSEPAGLAPVSLVAQPDPFDRRVITFGFPRQADAGVWSVGRLRGPQANGWVQIDLEETSQFAIQGGFSGAPVWDVTAEAVVGMVVAGFTGPGARTGYMIPAGTLFEAWPGLRELVRPPSPFRGLGAFGEPDAEWFFGRSELAGRVAELTRTAPAVTVVGPSGIGKSSLLHAGVLPLLRARAGLVVVTTRPTGAGTPLRSVALALDHLIEPDRDPVARVDAVTGLAGRLSGGATGEIVGAVLDRCDGRRLLLVLDQLEEALSGPAEDVAAFASVLSHVLAPGARLGLLASLRADFLGPALGHPGLAALLQNQRTVAVGELGRDELRRVITGPTERIGTVGYEPGLVERLLDDVGFAPGRLPLLQFTLTNLWERQHGGLLTHRAYDELGGVERTLTNHAEQVWANLDAADQKVAGRLLVQLVAPISAPATFVRRIARRDELDSEQWRLAGRLATARLVVLRDSEPAGPAGSIGPDGPDGPAGPDGPVAGASSAPGVELVHEALIGHWPRLGELGEADREFRTWQEGLRQRIRRWQSQRRSRDRLLVGADLRDARRWMSTRRADLSPADRGYVAASVRRRRVRASWGAGAAAVLLVAGAVTFTVRDRKLHDIAGADLAAKVGQVRAADPYGAAELALRGYRTRSDDATVAAVRSEFERDSGLDRLVPDLSAGSIGGPSYNDLSGRVSANGRVGATVTPDGRPAVWRIDRAGVHLRRLAEAGSTVDSAYRAALSADGRYAAFVRNGFPRVDRDGIHPTPCAPGSPYNLYTCVELFDTGTGRTLFTRQVRDLPTLRGVQVLAIDPTGRVLAAALPGPDNTYTVQSWDIPSGHPRARLTLPGRITDVAGFWLGPGARHAAVVEVRSTGGGSLSAELSYLDLSVSSVGRRVLTGGLLAPRSVAVSADGRRLAAAVGPPGQAEPTGFAVWDFDSGHPITRVTDVTGPEASGALALDPSGSRLFVTWRTDADAQPQPTDVRKLTSQLAQADLGRVSVWSLPSGTRSPVAARFGGPWDVLRPLGTGAGAPVALVNGDAVGLVLGSGRDSPLDRLTGLARTDPDESVDPDTAVTRLCRVLADTSESATTQKLIPAGAYQGPLCG